MSHFSIRRPVFTFVTMLLVIILGVVSLLNIPLKLIPEISPPVGMVVTTYPGASPEEVLEKVTKPLEGNLATLPGIKTMTSTSQEGATFILMEFSWSTEIDEIQNEIVGRIDQTTLPDDVDKPRFLKFDPSQFPVIQLSLSSEKEPDVLRDLAEQLRTELTKVAGVANVNVSGTTIKEVHVELDQKKLSEFGIAQADVVHVIQANNISMPGETILTEGKELTTRIISTVDSLDTLKNLILTVNPLNGEKIRLADISTVQVTKHDDRTITRTNDHPSVLLSVLQQSEANTAAVSRSFMKKLNELLQKETYKGIESDVLFDQGDFIKLAIGNITDSLIFGGVLAMIILFFFLRSVRSPFIIGIAIPYSVIVTFVLMYFSHYTLNVMTLGGLALGVGMLVDNSIVVIENIYRHLSMGKDPKEAAKEGAKEVGIAITASTLTTVAVFLPVVFITGIIGDLFTEFALTISFSLLASLFVALTVVPMLASRWLKAPEENMEKKRQNSRLMRLLDRTVRWSLRHRIVVTLIVLILLAGSLLGLTGVGTQFMPSVDEEYFSIRVELENGTALTETKKVTDGIEEKLRKKAEVETYVSLIGTTQEGSFTGSRNANIAEVYVKMKEQGKRERSTFEFVDHVRKEVERAAANVNKTAKVSFMMQSSAGTNPNTLTFNVRDNNEKRLKDSVDEIYDSIKDLDDITELSTDLMDQVDEIQMTVDRDRALQNDLTPSVVAMVVNDVTRGSRATKILDEGGHVYDVYVEYDKKVTKNLDHLKELLIRKPDGQFIPLHEVVEIRRGTGPVQIERINQQDAVQFTLKYKSSTNLGDISEKVNKKIKDLNLADETEIVYNGEKELLDSTMDDMFMALGLAVLFVYIVMAAQFESLKYPFVIMFTIPLVAIGVSAALILTRTSISLVAIIGMIVLAGIVVNNGIVIVDYINQMKDKGMNCYDAIIVSVKDRIRPVLMTALTTILGLTPLSLGIGEGAEIMQPMAISVIGGLVSSTFLTLFIIPIVYSFFDRIPH